MARRERIVNSAAALESMRNLGITLEKGVTELVDNSVDASATSIHIHIESKDGGHMRIIVADDGLGIPESDPQRPELSDTVQHVLRFGGKISHVGRRFPIGRFGFGLSQTATCLTTHTIVHSKTASGKWRSCFYDIEQLRKEDAMLPPEVKDDTPEKDRLPPGWKLGEQGTVVVLDDIDKPEWKRLGRLMNHLEKELGRIYRKSISEGLRFRISTSNDKKGRDVVPRDPLCQLPGSAEVEMFGSMDTHGTVTIRFDGKDAKGFPEFIDPSTEKPAEIRIRMVMVDVEKVRESLNIEDSAAAAADGRKLGKWGFNLAGQGFSVVRNGREIRNGESLGCFTKTSGHNYFRGEVEFPSCLDDLFKVQVIKSHYHLDSRLKDVIANRCQATISQIRNQSTTNRSRLSARRHASETADAEERSAGLRGVVQRRKIDKKEHERKRIDLKQRKEAIIDEVDREAKDDIAAAKEAVEQAKASQDAALIKLAEERAEAVAERAKRRKKGVRNRFKVDAFCRKFVKPLRGGDLYTVEDFHDEIWVTINSESGFFQELYERASQYPEQQALLDLVIFAIAYAEVDKANSDEMKQFWVDVRRNISRLSHIFVSMVEFEELPEDDSELTGDEDVDPATVGGTV